MAGRQRIDRVRRQYNQWVANQTLEDYALRFTAKSARRWSAARVANTALGAISFLALEAIGGTITLNYGVTNATAAILARAGYRVGCYTSPHLLRYNERVRIGGEAVSDAQLCDAFARIEATRGDTALTYFEFGTLVAWEVFATAGLDALILEVGLGGRLDAVNIFDADCAIVTRAEVGEHQQRGAACLDVGGPD